MATKSSASPGHQETDKSSYLPSISDDGKEVEMTMNQYLRLLRYGDADTLFLGVVVKLKHYRAGRKASYEAALDIGRLLLRARGLITHGDFGRACETVGLNIRTANNWIRLADAGYNADQIVELGGIRKALDGLAAHSKSENFSDLPAGDIDDHQVDDAPDVDDLGFHADDKGDDDIDDEPEKPPTRVKVLEAELSASQSRNDELEHRAAFEGDAEGLISAQELENRTLRSRVNDLITENESLRKECDRWQKRADGLAEWVPCCITCDKPVRVEDQKCPACA